MVSKLLSHNLMLPLHVPYLLANSISPKIDKSISKSNNHSPNRDDERDEFDDFLEHRFTDWFFLHIDKP